MKTSKVVLFILVSVIFLSLLGCGTRKSAKIEQKDVHTESVDSTHITTSRRDTFEWSKLETTRTGIRITITDLSPPDSLGRQHPTRRTEIDVNKEKESNENASAGTKLEQVGTEVDKNKLDDKSAVETKKDTDTRLIPVWVWWALLVAGVIAALLAWLVKRKRK